jgi:hypothetical protein
MWHMFCKIFEKKTGVAWNDIHSGWKRGIKINDMIKQKTVGEDGVEDHDLWNIEEPPTITSLEAKMTEHNSGSDDALLTTPVPTPSMTVVINRTQAMAAGDLHTRAKTPEHGW